LLVDKEVGGRHDEGQRQVKKCSKESLKHGLSECSREIILFRAVMDLVQGPKQVNLVSHPMGPVIAAVNAQEPHEPGNGRVPWEREQAKPLIHPHV
jgi:hypothetical protein